MLAVAACASAAQSNAPIAAPIEAPISAPIEAPIAAPIAAPVPAPDVAEAICAAADPSTRVAVRVEGTVLACDEGQLDRCHSDVRHVVANCGAEPLQLRMLRFADSQPGRGSMTVEPAEGLLAPRRSWTWKHRVFREHSRSLYVDVVDMQGATVPVAEVPIVITNPTRVDALAACEACGGVWGISGLVYREACNCKARDAGLVCRDGDECEGACIFERWDISIPAPRCRGKGCAARPAGIGRPLGRCSTRVALRSCHTLLQPGSGAQPEQAVPWGVSRICID